MKKPFSIKIGGPAGKGVKVSGLVLARALSRLGFSTFSYSEYPSLVRGGHNTYQVCFSSEEVFSIIKKIDLLIALNQETIKLHQKELDQSSLILYDPEQIKLPKGKLIGHYLALPFNRLAQEAGGQSIMANMVSLGAILTLSDQPLSTLEEIIEQSFKKKSQQVVQLNQKCAQAGRDFVNKKLAKFKKEIDQPKVKKKKLVLTGNEAAALGGLAGGLQFYSAYPMTPATSILHYLAAKSREIGIVVKHAEDEISAVNMAIGASFAGARVMTATSGGGLCLMAEAIGLAGVSETPLVVINSMRPGPALGMPTWSGQGDLQFSLHISQDEFPRILLAPGDAQETFQLTKSSLQLAEKYQLPVLILLDKYLSESDFSCQPFSSKHFHQRYFLLEKINNEADNFFKRYSLDQQAISPRPLPGQPGGIHCCNSYEHDEFGLATEEGRMRNLMMEKRMAKLALLQEEIPAQPIFGSEKAQIGLISWGSNKGSIRQALTGLKGVKFLHLNWLWPFPKEQVSRFINSVKKAICLEQNQTGQLALLIREQTGLEVENLLKYNGRPFWPNEILEGVKGITRLRKKGRK